MITLQAVSKRFGEAFVVRDVSLTIEPGETFVLIGPSGCGKSTTLKMMNGLVSPTEGSVLVGDKRVGEGDMAALRRGIGYVIQDVGLFAHQSVARNVAVVPELLGWPRERTRRRTGELLEMVGLPPGEFADRFPRQLSGGQRQRVGIARALAADPPLVLLDEPFGALDPITRERMQEEFAALCHRLGKTFVLVTHDIFEAVRLGRRIGVMRDGRLVQCGTPREIVHAPADDFVAALLGRHRYQLKLMTVPIAEAFERSAPGPVPVPVPDSDSVLPLPPDLSLWDALVQMDARGATHLALEPNPAGAPPLGRADLLSRWT